MCILLVICLILLSNSSVFVFAMRLLAAEISGLLLVIAFNSSKFISRSVIIPGKQSDLSASSVETNKQ